MSTTTDPAATVRFVFDCAANAYNASCAPEAPLTGTELLSRTHGPQVLGMWRDAATYVANELGAGPTAIAAVTGRATSTITGRLTIVRHQLRSAGIDPTRHWELRETVAAIYEATIPDLAPAGS